MKHILILTLFFFSLACSTQSIPSHPENIVKPELKFSPPSAERWEMDNGLVVYYLYDDEVPMVVGSLFYPAASVYSEGELAGEASLAVTLMRDGSVEGVSPKELDKKLDNLAASISTDSGSEYSSVSFSCLSEDFNTVFDIFKRVILTPAFDKSRLELNKLSTISGIHRRKESPGMIAHLVFKKVIFGETSPFGQFSTEQSINKISQELLRNFKNRYVRPNGSILAITGSIKKEELKVTLENSFKDWQKNELPLPEINGEGLAGSEGIYVVNKDLNQTVIYLGHVGPQRHSEQELAITLFNKYFSDGFGSVLFSQIRSKLGLAYSIGGGFSTGKWNGLFSLALATKSEHAIEALDAVLKVINEVREIAPSEVQLDEVKTAAEQSFLFTAVTPADVVYRKTALELNGFSADYDQHYIENLKKITPQAVNEVAKQLIDPKQFKIVIVGRVNAEELAKHYKGRFNVYEVEFDTTPIIKRKL